jgi:regulator of replication initiation timing
LRALSRLAGIAVTAGVSLSARLGEAARRVEQLVDELAAADELVTELVAENERLRARLSRLERWVQVR